MNSDEDIKCIFNLINESHMHCKNNAAHFYYFDYEFGCSYPFNTKFIMMCEECDYINNAKPISREEFVNKLKCEVLA